ncbi:MAG: peptidase M23, partial [Desulfovibrio sp.]|nr:peptidase M23 [Desulfovibrio sp.]
MTTPLDATALVTSQTGAADQSRRELQAKLTGLGGINGRKLSPEAQEKKLREACEGFESVFIQKMWQEMRNTIPKGGLMHGKEERFW